MPDTRNDLLRVLHAIPDSTQHQLAERMDINVRTVRRHVCDLGKSGDVLVSRDGHRNRYRLSPGTHPIPPVPQLTELEAEALTVAAQAGLGLLRPTPFAGHIERAVEKLERAWLQEVFSFEPESEADYWSFDIGAGPLAAFDEGIFRTLLEAARGRRPVLAAYYTASRRVVSDGRRLHPLGFWVWNGTWMLAAYCCKSERVKDFAVAGFRDANALDDETFDRPAGFDLHAHTRGRFGSLAGNEKQEVRLSVDANAAPYFRRKRYHASQTIEAEHEDGSIDIHFEVEGLEDISAWVLSWGPKVMVLEPEELVERVAETHRSAAGRYEDE